jgi:hypothetical protein
MLGFYQVNPFSKREIHRGHKDSQAVFAAHHRLDFPSAPPQHPFPFALSGQRTEENLAERKTMKSLPTTTKPSETESTGAISNPAPEAPSQTA